MTKLDKTPLHSVPCCGIVFHIVKGGRDGRQKSDPGRGQAVRRAGVPGRSWKCLSCGTGGSAGSEQEHGPQGRFFTPVYGIRPAGPGYRELRSQLQGGGPRRPGHGTGRCHRHRPPLSAEADAEMRGDGPLRGAGGRELRLYREGRSTPEPGAHGVPCGRRAALLPICGGEGDGGADAGGGSPAALGPLQDRADHALHHHEL